MIILGTSGGHDANWCVWRDGQLLGAFEKERFTRIRHDSGDVTPYLTATLGYLGIKVSEIDLIATSEPVAGLEGPGHERIGGRRYEHLGDWQWQAAKLLGRIFPCLSVPHHLAHAAYARFTSPFAETAVLTLDGGGDQYTVDARASTTVSSWRDNTLEWIQRVDYADFGSLWASYANAVFRAPHTEGKLMGLAAFGSDRLVVPMRESVLVPAEGMFAGSLMIKDCWPDYHRPPLLPRGADWNDQTAQDVAAAVQAVTTCAGVSLACAARVLTGKTSLALAGGVALNGYLVEAIGRDAGFDRTFVPPAVNDGGIAAGAALFAAHHELGAPYRPPSKPLSPFLGVAYSQAHTTSALAGLADAYSPVTSSDAVGEAAEVLARGGVVAWYEGRSEHGSRALGNRSILASPAYDAHRIRINRDVKFREAFRPVAPAVLEDRAAEFFDLAQPSPYMMRIVDCLPDVKDAAPAVVHRDGTARVQTVSADSSLGRIITEFDRLTGLPMVVNTSLNVGSPIVETPGEAAQVFENAPIDLAYINGFLAWKASR